MANWHRLSCSRQSWGDLSLKHEFDFFKDFLGLAFAPQSLIAPIRSFTLVSNIAFSKIFLVTFFFIIINNMKNDSNFATIYVINEGETLVNTDFYGDLIHLITFIFNSSSNFILIHINFFPLRLFFNSGWIDRRGRFRSQRGSRNRIE